MAEPFGFSDVPNWRNRERANMPRAPLDPKWDTLPASQNIEDRRQTPMPMLSELVHNFTGFLPSEIGAMARNPMTPMSQTLPNRYWEYPQVPATTTDPLASQAGYNDIGSSLMALQKYLGK